MRSKGQSWSIWARYVGKHKRLYFFGVLSVALTALLQAVGPWLLGWIVDFFSGERIPEWISGADKQDTFIRLFLAYFLTSGALIITRAGWRFFLGRNTHGAYCDLRDRAWISAKNLREIDYQTKFSLGNVMSLSTSDGRVGSFLFGFTLVGLFDVIFLGPFTVIAMMWISWKLTLAMMVLFPFLPIFIKRLADRESKLYDRSQDALSDLNDFCAQTVSTIRMQRQTQTESFWLKSLLEVADRYRSRRRSAIFLSILYSPLMGIGVLSLFAVLFFFGVTLVRQGELSIGEFVAIQNYVLLLQFPLMELGFVVSDIQRSTTSLARLAELYNTPACKVVSEGREAVEHQDTVLIINHLSFRYPGSNRPLFEDINLNLKKGDRLGIVGPIGAGKTTLLKIISGLQRGFEGEILFYGKSFDQTSHNEIRRNLAIVPQSAFLFADTIRNNICMDLSLTDEAIWEALEIAGVAEDVRGFENGLETQLGEWGVNLSGGQKQRLTLARAISRKPSVLMFDDCVSAVDVHTEEKILKALDQYLKGTTLVWVAHRSTTLRHCDQILEMSGE